MQTIYRTTRHTIVDSQRVAAPPAAKRAAKRPIPFGEPLRPSAAKQRAKAAPLGARLDPHHLNAEGIDPMAFALGSREGGVGLWLEDDGQVLIVARTGWQVAEIIGQIARAGLGFEA